MEKKNSTLICAFSNLLNSFLRANFSGPVPSEDFIAEQLKQFNDNLFSEQISVSNVKVEFDNEHPMLTFRCYDILNSLYLFQKQFQSLDINSTEDLV